MAFCQLVAATILLTRFSKRWHRYPSLAAR